MVFVIEQTKESLAFDAFCAAMVQAWNTHDPGRMNDLLDREACFIDPDGRALTGRDRITERLAMLHCGRYAQSNLQLRSTQGYYLGPDAALLRSEWSLVGHVGIHGNAAPRWTGVLVSVLRRSPEGWRILNLQAHLRRVLDGGPALART